MLTVLQICLLSACGALTLASLVFMIMFIVEISVKEKSVSKKVSIKKIIEKNKESKPEESQISVDEMLENLEKQTNQEESAKRNEVVSENVEEVTEIENTQAEEMVKNEEKITEVDEDSASEIVEKKVEENSSQTTEETNSEQSETIEVVEEIVDKSVEKSVKNEEVEEISDKKDTDDEDDDISEDDLIAYQKSLEPEIVLAPGTVIDYKARLDKIVNSKAKLERDLFKIQKFILKYERTERRKTRNQKMLDRRAGELTNLNLVMYSVTDIKNVDEEKKVKQEELTSHIAELKASIQDAEEYLESNKEKYNHNVKMAKFLTQERVRFIEEIAELEVLIKSSDENK